MTFWTSHKRTEQAFFFVKHCIALVQGLGLCIIICMCHAYGNIEYILVSMQYGMLYSCGEYFHSSFGLYTPALVQYPPVLHGN